MIRSLVPRALLLSLLVPLATGCVRLHLRYQRLPPEDRFAQILPGKTTRSDVLRLLGPPEDFRLLAVSEASRQYAVQKRNVFEAGRVFDREAYTYASERRLNRFVGVPSILSWELDQTFEERWYITFDEHDVVHTISHVDEGEPR